MDMKRINAGKLRAIGYAPKERVLRVEFDDGSAIDYAGVSNDVWKRFSNSGAAWRFYRANHEEEFPGTAGSSVLPESCACRVTNGRVRRVISRPDVSHSRSVRVTPSSATGESPGRRSAPSTASTTSGGFSCQTPRASPGCA